MFYWHYRCVVLYWHWSLLVSHHFWTKQIHFTPLPLHIETCALEWMSFSISLTKCKIIRKKVKLCMKLYCITIFRHGSLHLIYSLNEEQRHLIKCNFRRMRVPFYNTVLMEYRKCFFFFGVKVYTLLNVSVPHCLHVSSVW